MDRLLGPDGKPIARTLRVEKPEKDEDEDKPLFVIPTADEVAAEAAARLSKALGDD